MMTFDYGEGQKATHTWRCFQKGYQQTEEQEQEKGQGLPTIPKVS